jgi:CheY-like chemotaxis protein
MTTARRIILADDDPHARLVVARVLQRAYPLAEIVATSSGAEALRVYGEQGANALVLDYAMPPGMTGVDVVRALRARNDPVPIIMLSGDSGVQPAALQAGATHFITKGGSLDDLVRVLAAALPYNRSSGGV